MVGHVRRLGRLESYAGWKAEQARRIDCWKARQAVKPG
jgi:hypothetical protein